jgi:hypothetical protein
MERALATSLSDSDIREALPTAVVARLQDLPDDPRMWSLPTVLLYASEPSYGHWCALLESVDRAGEPCVSFFDSYGLMPDREVKWIPASYRKASGQDQAKVSQFLLTQPLPVTYSAARLQSAGKEIATCGRHCITRIRCAGLSDEEYAERLRDVARQADLTPDELVVVLAPTPEELHSEGRRT